MMIIKNAEQLVLLLPIESGIYSLGWSFVETMLLVLEIGDALFTFRHCATARYMVGRIVYCTYSIYNINQLIAMQAGW